MNSENGKISDPHRLLLNLLLNILLNLLLTITKSFG